MKLTCDFNTTFVISFPVSSQDSLKKKKTSSSHLYTAVQRVRLQAILCCVGWRQVRHPQQDIRKLVMMGFTLSSGLIWPSLEHHPSSFFLKSPQDMLHVLAVNTLTRQTKQYRHDCVRQEVVPFQLLPGRVRSAGEINTGADGKHCLRQMKRLLAKRSEH